MTLVGKILVIVIMACSLLFLGFSTVAFTTATNWKEATTKQKEAVTKLQGTLSTLTAEVEDAKKAVETAKADRDEQLKSKNLDIANKDKEISQALAELTQAKTALEKAQENANLAIKEQVDRTGEVTLLRSQNEAIRTQADEFKLSKTDLKTQVQTLERQLETAKQNNADLLDRVAVMGSFLRSKGLTDNIITLRGQIKGVAPPPEVEGVITRVDGSNRRVEISIGSDDGLVVGHELSVYRLKPKVDYLGKIKILLVEPDKAVGEVVGGKTYQGKKLEEGDNVTATIRARG